MAPPLLPTPHFHVTHAYWRNLRFPPSVYIVAIVQILRAGTPCPIPY